MTAAKGPVLVVDDDPDIREIIEIALTAHGYRVVLARDGRECMQHLRSGERPSIVLLDMMMPEMNGWAVCDQLAKDSAFANLPVVIITGNAEVAEERLGKFPVVRKPIGLAVLLEAIQGNARDT